jgi:hypothetical protein
MNNVPESPIQLLTLFASTSVQIDVFSDGVIESVRSGEIDPLKVLIQIRAMEKANDRILKEIKDNLLTAADKYTEQSFNYFGNTIQKGDVKTEYDYSICGDPIYNQRKSIMESAKTQLDERAAFLKTLKEPITIVDEGSGEIVTIRPPLKKTTPGLKVSIK